MPFWLPKRHVLQLVEYQFSHTLPSLPLPRRLYLFTLLPFYFYLNRGLFDFFIFGFKFIMVLGLFVCCFICKFGAYKPWAVGGRSGFDGVRQPS